MANRRSLSKTVLPLLVTALFLMVVVDPVVGQADPLPEEPSGPAEGNGPVRTVTPYYLKAVSGAAPISGTLSPAALMTNDTLAEVSSNGPRFPRFLINNVGTFTMYVSKMPLVIWGVNYASVWAKSNEDVQGAQFRVNLQKNGATQRQMSTTRSTLSNAPVELAITDAPAFPEPLVIMPGESLGVFIQYTANSKYPVGAAPGCIVLMNSEFHATRIELITTPFDMNVSAPSIVEGHLHAQGKVIDTSDVDPREKLIINLEIIPSGGRAVGASTIMVESFNQSDEQVLIMWSWDYKQSNAVEGLYEFKIDVSYGVYGINYTNSSFYEVLFPKETQEGSTLPVSTNMLLGLVIIAVLAIVGVALFMRRQRAAYPAGPYGARGPPRKRQKAKKPKMTRAQKKAMKKGHPPPGGPPHSPDRTPMPGRPPSGAGPPPKGAPPQYQGSSATGAPRPRRR
jgi:hypothetical protein